MKDKIEIDISELKRLDIVGVEEDGDIVYGIVEYDPELVKYDDEDGKGEYWDCNVVRFEGATILSPDEDAKIILEGKASEKKLERAHIISMMRFIERMQLMNMAENMNEEMTKETK